MTKERLETYISVKEEIKELKARIETLSEETTVHSVINDYRTGFPVPQSIVGVDDRRYQRLYQNYTEKIKELEHECKEIEDYIEQIPDSLTRRIFRMYYIDGIKQEKIARKLHIDQSRVSRKIHDFLKNA